MKQIRALLGALAIVAAACADANDPATPEDPAFSSAFGPAASATFAVTIQNLTDGQPFTPPLVAVHRPGTRLFRVGASASFGLKEIAENGNLAPMMARLADDRHVADFAVAFGPTIEPLLPGEETTVMLETERGALSLSWAAMLVCTNDGFTGADRLHLPVQVGASVTRSTAAYDAGTEINTEDFVDLVPPCPVLTGVSSSDPGTGVSNPALAENGVIHHHQGIAGVADLDPATHGWADPVARIIITRIQ